MLKYILLCILALLYYFGNISFQVNKDSKYKYVKSSKEFLFVKTESVVDEKNTDYYVMYFGNNEDKSKLKKITYNL